LLLGATDKALGLIDRLSKCFRDARHPELIEHTVATLVGQRVFGIALGYEDLNDHDELRHDPLMAVLAGKLEARRTGSRNVRAICSPTGPPRRRCAPTSRGSGSPPLPTFSCARSDASLAHTQFAEATRGTTG
jgi:hypothetical protein